MKNIAIIPARSGSKGLKDKNIKLLNGKPLLAYTIEAALKSKCFDIVLVSTDSKKYAEIAKKYGAEVPFLRNKETSTDKSSSWDVVKEVLDKYKKLGKEFDTFMLLQPTSPLRKEKHIKEAYKKLISKKALSIVSVCKSKSNPKDMYDIGSDLGLSKYFKNKNHSVRRQDKKYFYEINGAIYLADVNNFLKTNNIYKKDCFAYVMDEKSSVDIDDEFDFDFASLLIYKNNNEFKV